MAKVHIHIEGDSAADATGELVSLAALVRGAGLPGLDEGADAGETTAAPKGRGGRPRKDAAATTATETAGSTQAPTSAPAPVQAATTAEPAAPTTTSQPSTAESSAPAATTVSPAPATVTVPDVLAVINELSAKNVDPTMIQEQIQKTFGVARIGLVPPERLGEVIAMLRKIEAAQALV